MCRYICEIFSFLFWKKMWDNKYYSSSLQMYPFFWLVCLQRLERLAFSSPSFFPCHVVMGRLGVGVLDSSEERGGWLQVRCSPHCWVGSFRLQSFVTLTLDMKKCFSVYADDKTIIAFLPTTHCTFCNFVHIPFLTRTINAAQPCQN